MPSAGKEAGSPKNLPAARLPWPPAVGNQDPIRNLLRNVRFFSSAKLILLSVFV
jgi:hypothetical protein